MDIITSLHEWIYWLSNGIAHMNEIELITSTTHFRKHMNKNNWDSSTILTHVKATWITSVERIVLQTITIHVWKCFHLLIGFWIKRKFQDTSVHHYIINPDSEVLEPLLTHRRKYYRLSRLYGRSQGENSFASTNEGYLLPRVKLGLVTVRLSSWVFDLHDSSSLHDSSDLHVGLLDFHITLHWLQQCGKL